MLLCRTIIRNYLVALAIIMEPEGTTGAWIEAIKLDIMDLEPR